MKNNSELIKSSKNVWEELRRYIKHLRCFFSKLKIQFIDIDFNTHINNVTTILRFF